MAPDDLDATLARIRERSAAALEFPMSGFAEDSIRCCTQSAMDVPLLLGAVERLSELADEWEQEAIRLQGVAREQAARGTDDRRKGTTAGMAVTYNSCGAAMRGAITAALGGKEAGGELAEPAS